jgi:glycosyltransferase involved in cell wall biosynthesis
MSVGKHLLILHQAYVAGGAELTTKNILDGLDRTLFTQVTLMCPHVMTGYWTQGYDQWLDSAPLGLAGWFDTPARLWRDARALSQILREQYIDLAIGMMQYSAAVLALAKLMAGTPTRLLASYRGPVFEHLAHFEPSRWRRIWISAAICASAHASQGVTMPSQGTARELGKHCRVPERRLHMVYNGLDYAEAQRRSALPVELPASLREGEPFAIVAARLSEEKRLDWVIQALAQMETESELKLLILGDGSARSELEALSSRLALNTGDKQRVVFHGQVSDTLPYIARATMFIHTCQYEGFGYSMLEALACGTPVIATDCPYGPRELLRDPASMSEAAGLLVPMKHAPELAAAMSRLMHDAALRCQLIERGTARAQELSLAKMQAGHRQVMRELMTYDEPR